MTRDQTIWFHARKRSLCLPSRLSICIDHNLSARHYKWRTDVPKVAVEGHFLRSVPVAVLPQRATSIID